MKLLYTCGIEAAYMAKNFDVKFKSARGQNMYFDGGSDFRTEKDCGIYGGEVWNVHPDSLHIFEPQEGDFVEIDGFYNDRTRHEWAKDAPYDATPVKIIKQGSWLSMSTRGIGYDNNMNGKGWHMPFKIIQRNGIAFMWPDAATRLTQRRGFVFDSQPRRPRRMMC